MKKNRSRVSVLVRFTRGPSSRIPYVLYPKCRTETSKNAKDPALPLFRHGGFSSSVHHLIDMSPQIGVEHFQGRLPSQACISDHQTDQERTKQQRGNPQHLYRLPQTALGA